MLDRMDQRFKLLASSGGRRERQATLRATLDWSWDLLSKAEQAALVQLSVFEGGFSLEAAENVIALPATDAGVPWVPDVVQGLVEKSLLRNAADQRFEMLRSVQDYAAERLGKLEFRGLAYQRHWTYFASLDESSATAQRCVERENLIAACRRAAAASDVTSAVGALSGASAALQLTGPFRAVLELVNALEESTDLHNRQHRAVVDRVAGTGHLLLGEADKASVRFEKGLEEANAVKDVGSIIRILCLTANLAASRSTQELASSRLEHAMKLANSSGDSRLRFRVFSAMGALRQRTGQLVEATKYYESAIEIARALGNKHWQGGMYGNLGFIALTQGRLADARTHLEAGLACAHEMGDRQWEGNARCNLGLLLYQLGESKAAEIELEGALVLARSIGYRRLEATVLCNLGIVADDRGDPDRAERWYREAVLLASELADDLLEAQSRGYLGLLLAKLRRTDESELQFIRAADKAAGAEPATLAMLYCQRAIAAAERGDESSRNEWLAHAERLLGGDEQNADFELRQALQKARASRANPS